MKKRDKEERVLGIDPGYDRLGIAVVEGNSLIHSKCFTTLAKDDFYVRIRQIGEEIKKTIEEYRPTSLAIENLFITKNQKTAMRVSETRGVIIYEATLAGLKIFEYSPPEIKSAITGDGKSDKTQIIKMIPLLIKINGGTEKFKPKMLDDEYDAIAVALTCLAIERF